MKIKRITLIIYFAILIFGIILLYNDITKYSIDIIIAVGIPIAILLPEYIIYKISGKRYIYNCMLNLKTQLFSINSSISYFRNTIHDIPNDPLEKDINVINSLIDQFNNIDPDVYLTKKHYLETFFAELRGDIPIINLSNTTLKYVISKYKYERSNPNIDNGKYLKEIDRQLTILNEICNELINKIDYYSDAILNKKDKNRWKLQESIIKNSYKQEAIRSKV